MLTFLFSWDYKLSKVESLLSFKAIALNLACGGGGFTPLK
jgi:hypothetical protein